MMLTTPGGKSISCKISARRKAVNDVVSAGLSTTVFPQASAGAIFHAAIIKGKFHGMICPQTPIGSGALPLDVGHAQRNLSHHPA